MKNHSSRLAETMIVLALSAIQSLAQSVYEPYTFTTLAGGGGVTSPDQAGNAARFNYPNGVAVDSAGNVYVADTFSHTIRKGYAPPRLLDPGFNSGEFRFNLTGPPGRLLVETSPDLVSWLPIATNSFTGSLNLSDPQGGVSSNRFSRAQVQ